MTEIKQLTCITCHAWNSDKTKFAFCPNNNEIYIYAKTSSGWEEEHVLREHDSVVTGIDWAPNTNRIVTSSQDRNSYVWTFQNGVWKPTLVILRLPKSATSVKWSPKENKFAVSSSAKCVAVCYFEQDNDFWVSKHIKKHKSTVLRLAWHPNNIFLATAASDFKARVFSAFIKGIDEKPGETPFGSKLPFGELLAEYTSNGWVNSVTWSANGNRMAFASHDSTVTFIDVTNGAPGDIQVLKTAFLPLSDLLFLTENSIVAGGHDSSPLLFTNNNGKWEFNKVLTGKKETTAKVGGTKAAFELFKNKVEVGANTNIQTLDTLHQNCITYLQPMQKSGNEIKVFSTSGLDGKFCQWTI